MRRLIAMLMLTILIVPAFAAEGDAPAQDWIARDSFLIKGYKVEELSAGEFEFSIIDAISESLNTFTSAASASTNRIDMTNHLEDFIIPGAVLNEKEPRDSNIVFSLRVAGAGSFDADISFTFAPFYRQLANGDDTSNAINAKYLLQYRNFVFSDSSKTSDNGYKGYFDIEEAGSPIASRPYDKDADTKTISVEIKQPLKVDVPSGDPNARWIFRAAVFSAIYEEDYEAAPVGEYTAAITATITVNS